MDRCNSPARWASKALFFLAAGLFFLSAPVHAAFPALPILDGLTELSTPPKLSAGSRLAQVTLATGDVRLVSANQTYSISNLGVDIAEGDVLVSGPSGRFRLLMEGGDVFQVGENSLLAVGPVTEKQQTVTVWRGMLTFYGFPSLQGEISARMMVYLPHGNVHLPTGKAGIHVSPSEDFSRLFAFKSSMAWQDGQGNQHRLSPGRGIRMGASEVREEPLSENAFTLQTSPEGPAVVAALQLYESKDYTAAIRAFTQVQKTFPYNSMAVYYLGLAYLAQDDLGPTIRHWRQYEKIDPEGARKNDISQNLTVLISKRMKEEVKEALAQEKSLIQSDVEPNSIAVSPFANKGQPKFEAMAKGITAMIIADLSKVPGIKVLERAKMQQLINEINLSKSGLVSEETRVRAGRLMKAEKLVMGDYAVE